MTTPVNDTKKQKNPAVAEPSVETVGNQVAKIDIGITPAENVRQVNYWGGGEGRHLLHLIS